MEFENRAFLSDHDRDKTPKAVSSESKDQLGDLAEVLIYAQQWRRISTHRRQWKKDDMERSVMKSDDAKHESVLDVEHQVTTTSSSSSSSDVDRSLLKYFAAVSSPESSNFADNLDGEFIISLLQQGARLSARDKFGQTVLHEVARNWNVSVMDSLIKCGGDPNARDFLGRTPLHVAAASNFAEMCRLLLRRGAQPEARTTGGQTPLFFAAKTDSTRALHSLVSAGCCYKNVFDARGRSPLYVAAELDRSETASLLLDLGADAFVQDKTGQVAFVPLVEKMPSLAKQALKQLHNTYRIERKQTFDLFRLHPLIVDKEVDGKMTSVPEELEVDYFSAARAVTNTNNYAVIETPVMRNFLETQWQNYGWKRAIGQVVLQLLTIILWTLFAIIKEWTQRFQYNLPDEAYRILILIAAIGLTGYNIGEEIYEYYCERRRHVRWQQWKTKLLEDDMKLCHPRFPDELAYLKEEQEAVNDATVSYFNDAWNYLDWVCYVVLLASLVSHFIDVWFPGGEGNLVVARWHVRIMAVNIVLLWVRLLKYVKPFEFFGPFIVMLGLIINDLVKFFFLYLEFFIPFACVFWTILGGPSNLKEVDVLQSSTLANYTRFNLTRVTVDHLDTIENMLFTLFRLTLVDEYDYEHMIEIDQITAQILLGAWFALSSILLLNLFIAQLSETFKAVYDNAKATASMQKAITLNAYYDNMMQRSKIHFHRHLKKHCSPLRVQYDDDVTQRDNGEEMQKATLQIRSDITDLKCKFEKFYADELRDSDSDSQIVQRDEAPDGAVKSLGQQKAFTDVNDRIHQLEMSLRSELTAMKATLQDIAIVVSSSRKQEASVERRGKSRRSRRRSTGISAEASAGVIRVQPADADDQLRDGD